MTRHIIAILTIALSALGVCAASSGGDARAMLDKAATKLESAPSVKATYSLSVKGHSAEVNGSLLMASDRFTASAGDITTWYDGTTQWTYVPANNEVTVIEPSPEELLQSNPLAIIRSLRSGYSASVVKSAPGTRSIRLVSTAKGSEFKQVTVTLTASTLLPSAIKATMADGNEMNIRISSISLGGAVSPATFKYDKTKHGKVRVNDMR